MIPLQKQRLVQGNNYIHSPTEQYSCEQDACTKTNLLDKVLINQK